nr:PREDICTED: tankyrase-2-like [Bemisia tabaci]XP_018903807.1 PREDICTED: tankyrase-2-like [Bemisia tabaci]XP_018903808.1 PREDICTED: tankyrase-2-like [Bemisia tabaci]XP_018903809.1 PREDICTED: tankyrase-2-like [Bemisia tabaci]
MEFRHPLKIPALDNGKLKEDDPLIRAIEAKDLETVRFLIETNDKYKPRIQEDPELLITAVSRENVELVELLIHHGANVNAKSQEGPTPLSQAVALDNIELTRLLISKGADLKYDTESLSLAVAWDYRDNDVVELLLQNGANPNARSRGIEFAIFAMGPKRCVRRLERGRTALHLAADLNKKETLRLLLAYGADVDRKTLNQLTPLFIAVKRDHGDIVRVLLESDAVMDACTALHAAALGRWRILNILLDFFFNKPEISLESDIYHHPRVKRRILANDPQPNRLRRHLFMAHAAEVKVPTNLKPLINDIVVRYPEEYDACTLEIQTLKTQYIGDSDVTFFQLLVADLNSLAVLARNDSISSGLELAVKEEKFPFHWSILTSQLHKGVARRDLMERGIALSPRLVPDFQLPDLVVERVLQYLSNKDINAFIGACSLRK